MNRFYLCIVCVFFSSIVLQAQTEGGVSIGKDGSPANDKAILDLVSQSKGLLIPRMSTEQRNAIFGGTDEGTKGLMVFDNSQNAFYYWDGSAWRTISAANAKVVSGTPTGSATAGELAFDIQNSLMYIYSGSAWIKANGADSGSAVNLDPKWLDNHLLLGIQDGKTVTIDFNALNVKVAPKTSVGLSSSTVQDALEELAGKITTANTGSGLLAVEHDSSLKGSGTTSSALGIADGGVTADKLGHFAVTDEKLADNVVSESKLKANSVTTDKIANAQITPAKMSSEGSNKVLVTNALGTPIWASELNGDVTGLYNALEIKSGTIVNADIKDGTILGEKLAQMGATDGQVLGWKASGGWEPVDASGVSGSIADNTITASKLAGSGGVALTNGGGANYVLQSNGDGTFSWLDISGEVSADPSSLALPTGQFFVGNASSKAAATAKNAIPLSGFGAAAASVDLGTNRLINVADPTNVQDAATKNYVDSKVPAFAAGDASKVLSVNAAGTATEWSTSATSDMTSVTGLLKGDGSAISAAVAGTDFLAPGAGSLTIGTGANAVTLSAPSSNTGAYNLVLPTTNGTADYVLKTDGSGALRWDVDATGAPAGGIASIDLDLPLYTDFTPLTTDGTITGTLSDQSANRVLAGPASGASAAPTFRALVAADVPSLDWAKIATGKPTTLAGYGITDALSNPMTASGDIVIGGASGAPTRLAAGANDQVLTISGGVPTWASASSGATDLAYTPAASSGTVTSSTGNNATLPAASTTAAGLMTATDKTKLNAIDANANNYTLPTASTTVLGGVKVDGNTVTINSTTGVISASGGGGMTNPMTTAGDMIIGGSGGAASRLAAGAADYVLTSNGAGVAPSWKSAVSGSDATTASNGVTESGDDVQLGGSLSKATEIAQGANNLTFSNTTGRTIVDGTFQMSGAVYAQVRTMNTKPTGDSDWLDNDYIVNIQSSGAGTITLPDPAAHKNRVLIISNLSAVGGGTAGTYNYTVYMPVNSASILSGKSQMLVSDGTRWIMVVGAL